MNLIIKNIFTGLIFLQTNYFKIAIMLNSWVENVCENKNMFINYL